MSYSRKPNYHFNDKTATGVDKVPVGRIVIVEDFNGKAKAFIKIYDANLTDTTTVEEAVNLNSLQEHGENEFFNDVITKYTATAGQTTFNVDYNTGFIDVYKNGTLLSTDEYIATNETTITLKSAAAEGDNMRLVSRFSTADYSVLYGDFYSDGVLYGLTSAASVNLTGTIEHGVIYINGRRVDISESSRVYTASVDTYIDVNSKGELIYQEVSSGAGAPGIEDGNLRLMKLVSDVDNITSYTDLRVVIDTPIVKVQDDSSPVLGGDLNFNTYSSKLFSVHQDTDVTVPSGSTHTFDFNNGNIQEVTCAPSSTMTIEFANYPSGVMSEYTILVIDGGGCTITYPSETLFAGGTVPTLTANGTDMLKVLIDKDGVPFITVAGLDLKTV